MKKSPSSPGSVRRHNLTDEILFLSILFSTLIIIGVQIASLFVISSTMIADLKAKSVATADETVVFLTEPLYNVDETQAVRICEELLSSGRVSGIRLESAATGILLEKRSGAVSRSIPSISRSILHEDIPLGTVEFRFSDRDVIETRKRLIAITISVVVASVSANLLAYRSMIRTRARKPLEAIFSGIDSIAAGNYDTPIAETAFNDVNAVVSLVNAMAAGVRAKNLELLEANTMLERRVAERTVELERSLKELRQAQDHLVASEKLSTLGHLSAGMAHELNTPLGAILSSNRSMIDYLDNKQLNGIAFLSTLDPGERTLYDTALELGMRNGIGLDIPVSNRKARQLAQAELQGEGIPNAGEVAEYLVELNIADRPDGLFDALRTGRNAEILSHAADPVIARRMAEIVELAARKAANVVAALRSYLAPESDEMGRVVDVNRELEKVVTLTHNMLKHGIQVRCEFSGARVNGSSDKLGQVWMNLIRNAAQAMDFRGELVLRTETSGGMVRVSIVDSGPGIPEAIRGRIFEPFFTTKKQGEGMGLGLDICRRIVEAHKGTISVDSRPGRTEFVVTLPAAGEAMPGYEPSREGTVA